MKFSLFQETPKIVSVLLLLYIIIYVNIFKINILNNIFNIIILYYYYVLKYVLCCHVNKRCHDVIHTWRISPPCPERPQTYSTVCAIMQRNHRTLVATYKYDLFSEIRRYFHMIRFLRVSGPPETVLLYIQTLSSCPLKRTVLPDSSPFEAVVAIHFSCLPRATHVPR